MTMARDTNWTYERGKSRSKAGDEHDRVRLAEEDYPDENLDDLDQEPAGNGGAQPTGKGDLEDLKGILSSKFGIELPSDTNEKNLIRTLCVALHANGGNGAANGGGMGGEMGGEMEMGYGRRRGRMSHARGTARGLSYAHRPAPITPERARQAADEQLRASGFKV